MGFFNFKFPLWKEGPLIHYSLSVPGTPQNPLSKITVPQSKLHIRKVMCKGLSIKRFFCQSHSLYKSHKSPKGQPNPLNPHSVSRTCHLQNILIKYLLLIFTIILSPTNFILSLGKSFFPRIWLTISTIQSTNQFKTSFNVVWLAHACNPSTWEANTRKNKKLHTHTIPVDR